MPDDYDEVIASYHRCEDTGGLFETFYGLFFSKSPEIPPKFAKTDMQRQQQIVMASLLWVLRLYRGDPIARREVIKIAETHNRDGYNIEPKFYEMWLDALCESVAKHDPEYTSDLDEKWRHVMGAGINLITSMY